MPRAPVIGALRIACKYLKSHVRFDPVLRKSANAIKAAGRDSCTAAILYSITLPTVANSVGRVSRSSALAVLREDKLELGGLLHGQVSWSCTFENFVDVGCGAPRKIKRVRCVAHETGPPPRCPRSRTCSAGLFQRQLGEPRSLRATMEKRKKHRYLRQTSRRTPHQCRPPCSSFAAQLRAFRRLQARLAG